MNARQRVLNNVERKPFDRFPVKHYGEPEVNAMLMDYFGIRTELELLEKIGDDFRNVAPRYVGPELKTFEDGSREGIWGERYKNISFGAGEYRESIYQPFKAVEGIEELDQFRWPSLDWYDFSTLPQQCERFADYAIVGGWPGGMDLINGIAQCRGVEQVLLDIAVGEPVYIEIAERRARFFHDYFKSMLEAGLGKIDIIHVGDDFGTQKGLLISPTSYQRIFKSKYQKLADLVHGHGAKLMLHSCGSVRGLLPELIETGIDIYDVVQVSAAGMDIGGLRRDFGDKLAFCGTICVQTVLPFGSVNEVRREVALRKSLFAEGGLIIGPTHAIQVGTPLENILEMYRSAGSLPG